MALHPATKNGLGGLVRMSVVLADSGLKLFQPEFILSANDLVSKLSRAIQCPPLFFHNRLTLYQTLGDIFV